MDGSDGWAAGAPDHHAWTQGPWHGDTTGQGPADQGTWQQGPWSPGPGFGGDDVYTGDWTVTPAAAPPAGVALASWARRRGLR